MTVKMMLLDAKKVHLNGGCWDAMTRTCMLSYRARPDEVLGDCGDGYTA